MMIIVRKQRKRAELDQSRTPVHRVVPASLGVRVGLASLVNSFGGSFHRHVYVCFTHALGVP